MAAVILEDESLRHGLQFEQQVLALAEKIAIAGAASRLTQAHRKRYIQQKPAAGRALSEKLRRRNDVKENRGDI